MRHPAVVNAQQSTVCVGFGVIQGFSDNKKKKKNARLVFRGKDEHFIFLIQEGKASHPVSMNAIYMKKWQI